MTMDARERDLAQVYAHSLICWPSIIAGALVAVGLGVMFNLLGVAIGASAFDPTASLRGQAQTITLAAGIWLLVATAVAMCIGAYVAARSAKFPDHRHGLFQGVTVWALAVLLIVAIGGFSLRTAAESADETTAALMAPQQAQTEAGTPPSAAATPGANANTGAAPPPMTRSEAESLARATRDALAVTAWWSIATLLFGLGGSLLGARMGAAHPTDWPRVRMTPSPSTL
ncbi:MAG: hypothetical protein AB1429_11455 [Pseudomonadota bacterium]|jgi:hypothetical protein